MPFHLPRRLRVAAPAMIMAAAAAAGCSTAATASPVAGPELAHVTVALTPATDGVPLEIAQERGFFARQGLTVTTVPVKTSTAATASLLRGSVQVIDPANYVSYFTGEANGAYKIMFIAPAADCTGRDFAVMVPKGSPIQKPADLAGKTIGVQQTASTVTLTIDATLTADGVNPASVHFVPVPFQDGLGALENHSVDAVSLIEPFLTQAAVRAGAVPVLEQCTGPTANLPLTGAVSTAQWAGRHPRTAAAFARALSEGAEVADTSRPAEEKALAVLVPAISPEELAVVNFNAYPLALDPAEIQANADLMFQDGVVKKPVNDKTMLFLPPAGDAR